MGDRNKNLFFCFAARDGGRGRGIILLLLLSVSAFVLSAAILSSGISDGGDGPLSRASGVLREFACQNEAVAAFLNVGETGDDSEAESKLEDAVREYIERHNAEGSQ